MPVLITAALTALLLCDCTWNIGRCIKDTAITHTGVDTTRPVGGVVYKGRGGDFDFYMQAPEVTFRPSHRLVRAHDFHEIGKRSTPEPVCATGIKPTGRLLWVKLYGSIGWTKGEAVKKFSPSGPLAVVDSPPAGLKPFPIDEKVRMENGASVPIGRLGPAETRHGTAYPLAAAAAAPFQYVVDPVLDVAGHAAFGVFYLIGATISSPVWVPQAIMSQRSSKQRD